MRKSRLRRPSPALIVSSVALFMALGGGAYAASSSDNKQDKKIANTAAKKYFNNNIGGAHVSFANSAGSAGSATSATNATNATNAVNAATAGNANTVGGLTVKKFSSFLASGAAATALVDVAGITISGACPAGVAHITATKDSGQPTTAFNYTSSSTGSNNTTFTNGTSNFATFDMTSTTPNTVGEYVATSSAGTSSANYMARDVSGGNCTFAGTVIGG
jgi:hypothetical protein